MQLLEHGGVSVLDFVWRFLCLNGLLFDVDLVGDGPEHDPEHKEAGGDVDHINIKHSSIKGMAGRIHLCYFPLIPPMW